MSAGPGQGHELNWMITAFADRVAAVAHAVVVSADGLPLAFSVSLPEERVDQLAAIAAAVAGITRGAAWMLDGGGVVQTVIEMREWTLILTPISDGSALVVLAEADCDMSLVAYEMSLLAERAGRALTPDARGDSAGGPPFGVPRKLA